MRRGSFGELSDEVVFARQYGIDLKADKAHPGGKFMPVLNQEVSGPVRVGNTMMYRYWQLDYYAKTTGHLLLSRAIAELDAGSHTEVAFRFRPTPQPLVVHQGKGSLILAGADWSQPKTTEVNLNAKQDNHRRAVILPNHFYAIKAAVHTPEPLVVSSLYAAPLQWEDQEVGLDAEAQVATIPAGSSPDVLAERRIPLPNVFLERLASN